MTDQQQETSPMSDLIQFPGGARQRVTPGAAVAATAERLPEPDTTENEAGGAEAEVIDFPAPRTAEADPAAPATVGEDVDEPDGDGELALRPDTVPARRRGHLPPALSASARRAGQLTAAASVATARGTARAGVATARGTVRAAVWSAPHAKSSGVFVIRHTAYCAGGGGQMVRMVWRRLAHSELDDAINAARVSGDLELAARLQHEKNQSANDRWKRIATQLKVSAIATAVSVSAWTVTTTAVAIWGGIAELVPGGADWTSLWINGWWGFNTGVADMLMWAASWWAWMAAIGILAGLVTAWRLGRNRETAPAWVAPQRANVPADEVQVTADRLVTALRHCGIPELRQAIKDGETAGMVDLISQYGPGVRTTITLPRGISATKLTEKEKAASLASSLSRGEHEVSLSQDPNNNSRVELWVARPGALDEPVPASPMMDPDYGPVDLYKDPVPWGHSPQGEPIELDLIQRHLLIAGLSKQGKTASARALALHAACDPSVELRIADLKGVGDWSMFDGIASVLIEGAGEEHELATATMVEKGAVEMDRRKAARRAKNAKGDITAAEARDGSGDHHPLIIIVDEVQIAYMSQAAEPEFDAEGNEKKSKSTVGGQKNNSRLWQAAKRIHDQGRAVNVHLWQFAQNPTDRNLPAIVREGAHVRGSLYVSNPSIARKAIGDPPVDAGAAPYRLRSEIDAGTVVVAGAPEIVKVKGEMANTVRTHFIDTDPAYTVAERAKQLRAEAGQATATADGDATVDRDVLADVAKVLGGEDRITAKACSVRLGELAPGFYKGWTGKGLHTHLTDSYDMAPGVQDGTPVVRLDRVRQALSEREGTE